MRGHLDNDVGTQDGSAPVGGTGTVGTIPKWTGTGTLGDSPLTVSGTQTLFPNGTAGAPSLALAAAPTFGIFSNGGADLSFSISGTRRFVFASNELSILYDAAVIYLGLTGDCNLARDAAGVLALRNGTTAQEFRVYGTTTGSKYLSLTHDGNSAILSNVAGTGQIAFRNAANATGATAGYMCIPSSAGAPTGVPANIPTGQIPFQYDSTNNKLYAYNGSWKKAQVSAVDVIFG